MVIRLIVMQIARVLDCLPGLHGVLVVLAGQAKSGVDVKHPCGSKRDLEMAMIAYCREEFDLLRKDAGECDGLEDWAQHRNFMVSWD